MRADKDRVRDQSHFLLAVLLFRGIANVFRLKMAQHTHAGWGNARGNNAKHSLYFKSCVPGLHTPSCTQSLSKGWNPRKYCIGARKCGFSWGRPGWIPDCRMLKESAMEVSWLWLLKQPCCAVQRRENKGFMDEWWPQQTRRQRPPSMGGQHHRSMGSAVAFGEP